jgi:peptidoglycan hydrolase-like protein with peptidoglycan-binding domain
MAKNIVATVGRGGVNRTEDVRAIQELLNKVPEDAGGLRVKLIVDGICGSATRDAIHRFQVRQFGATGADGRVDPGGRTLRKLNDYDSPVVTQPPGAQPVLGEFTFVDGNITVTDFRTGTVIPARVGTAVRASSAVSQLEMNGTAQIAFKAGFLMGFSGRAVFSF